MYAYEICQFLGKQPQDAFGTQGATLFKQHSMTRVEHMKSEALRPIFRRIVRGAIPLIVITTLAAAILAFPLRAQEVSFGKDLAVRLTLFEFDQPALHTFLQGINFPSLKSGSGSEATQLRGTGKNTWEFYRIFSKIEEPQENGGDSTFALLRRNMPARHNYSTYAKVQTGVGQFFPGDTVGLSRINGAGVDEPRYLYVQLCFKF